jgi:hypothetical protein
MAKYGSANAVVTIDDHGGTPRIITGQVRTIGGLKISQITEENSPFGGGLRGRTRPSASSAWGPSRSKGTSIRPRPPGHTPSSARSKRHPRTRRGPLMSRRTAPSTSRARLRHRVRAGADQRQDHRLQGDLRPGRPVRLDVIVGGYVARRTRQRQSTAAGREARRPSRHLELSYEQRFCVTRHRDRPVGEHTVTIRKLNPKQLSAAAQAQQLRSIESLKAFGGPAFMKELQGLTSDEKTKEQEAEAERREGKSARVVRPRHAAAEGHRRMVVHRGGRHRRHD